MVESLQAVAFDRHTYGQGVIGSKYEIKMMTRDGLYAHYRTHYAPNNAFVVVVGDDKAETLVEKAAAAFGPLKAEPAAVRALAPEPPQMGEKRLVVHRAGGALPIGQAGFHTAAPADPQAPALPALPVALAGGPRRHSPPLPPPPLPPPPLPPPLPHLTPEDR